MAPRRWAWAVKGVRRVWELIGVALVIGLCAALGFVLAGRWSASLPHAEANARVIHPYAGQDWFPAYDAEFVTSSRVRWAPYVYWRRRPFAGRYINVDSNGFRRSVQASSAPGAHREVWFFGGSMLWGTWQRDSMTIASNVARGLARSGVTDVDVRNFGETGYVFTQEVLQLLLQLRAGERPAVVVFYDGANDIVASTMSERCGIPQNESRREFEFSLGRAITSGGASELADFVTLFVRRAQQRLDEIRVGRGGAPTRTLHVDAVAERMVACYAQTARLAESLARDYGFRILYFWQPMPGTTTKRLTPFESTFLAPTKPDGFREYVPALARGTSRQVDAAMAQVAAGRFHNLSALFTGDTSTVWMDFVGHITERANLIAADRMVGPVLAELNSSRSRLSHELKDSVGTGRKP